MSIELKNVTFTYSQGTAYESHALKDINLVIPDGQFIGVIGHTGSGKSGGAGVPVPGAPVV